MLTVMVHEPVTTDRLIIEIHADHAQQFSTTLLGTTGQQIQTFVLREGMNAVDMQSIPPGHYSLKTETSNEIDVRQVEVSGI